MNLLGKTIGIALWLLILTAYGTPVGAADFERWQPVDGHLHKLKSYRGYSNCIFSIKKIIKDRESEVPVKDLFFRPEPVYARCYFPKPLKSVEAGDFWHEIWIGGTPVKRTIFEQPPDPGMDQTQIWVSEEDYKDEISALGLGEHEIVIWVMMNRRDKKGARNTKPVKLSKGVFSYMVRE